MMNRKTFWFLVGLIVLGLLSSCLTLDGKPSDDDNPSNGGDDEGYWLPIYFDEAPTIDGRLIEWEAYEPLVTFGPGSRILSGSIDSADDLTLKIWMGWDYDYIYLAIEAIDDSLPQGDVGFWDHDDVQLMIDARNDSTAEEYAEALETEISILRSYWKDDDYRVIIQPANNVSLQTRESFIYISSEKVLTLSDNGYTFELAIEISDLPLLWVSDGHVMGLDFEICDADWEVNEEGESVLNMGRAVSNDELPVDPWGGADYYFWKLNKCKFEVR